MSRKSKSIEEDIKQKSNQNSSNEIYEFLKEENKKVLFEKIINNYSEQFLTENKLNESRLKQIPYFKFDPPEENNNNNNPEKDIEKKINLINNKNNSENNFEAIKLELIKEITVSNEIIYAISLLSHYLIVATNEYLKIFDLENEYEEVKSICIKDVFLYCLDTTKINNIFYIAMGGKSNSIFLYTINNNSEDDPEKIEELIGHKNDINELKFLSKQNNILLSASSDSTIRIWDVTKLKLLCIYGGPFGHPSHVLTIDFHHSEKFLASAGFDQVVMFWDMEFVFNKYNEKKNLMKVQLKTKPFFESLVHENYIDTVKFLGDLVLSKSTNGVILLWKPMFNDEKDHHFIIKKLYYTASKLWYVKFHLNLVANLLFVGDVGCMNIFNLNNQKYSNVALPDICSQVGSKKNDALFRCVVYENDSNLVIIGTDDGKLYFSKLIKEISNNIGNNANKYNGNQIKQKNNSNAMDIE